MTLDDLDPADRIAFAALVRFMVRADGVFSPAEGTAVTTLAREVGSMAFWQAMQQAQQSVVDPEDLRNAAAGVEDPAVREWIYEVLVGMAAADGNMGESEGRLLDWVRAIWSL